LANFLVVVDPDSMRRTTCARAAPRLLEVAPGMTAAFSVAGDCAMHWMQTAQTPCSIEASDARNTVVWGDAFGTDAAVVGAADVQRAWTDVPRRVPPSWDGFFAAVAYQRGVVVAGADRLGLFPIYYWSRDDVCLIASSPAAFPAHPAFVASFNPAGACAILLTGGPLDGETLWVGVRRLAPGHLLAWSHATGAREIAQFSVPVLSPRVQTPFDAQVEHLDAIVDHALMRQVRRHDGLSLLLSGGRDARLAAALLQRHGVRPHAISFGMPQDHDVRCAEHVAAALGLRHDVHPDPLDDAATLVRRHVRVEQLSHGMANFHTWGAVPLLVGLGDRVVSGYVVEAFTGGTCRVLPPSLPGRSDTERFVNSVTAYGVAPDRLRRVLRPQLFGDAVDDVLANLRQRFDALPGDADDRAWQFCLAHRARFHPGSAFWRLTMTTWPIVWPLGPGLIEAVAALPVSTLAHRRAQDALLRRKFPELARLPLDRNSDDTTPLLPSVLQRVRRRVLPPRRHGAVERRRYYRLYDINAPHWRTVRRLAHEARSRCSDLVDPIELDALLPPADQTIALGDPIVASHGLKSLLGLMIWCQDNA
jgi:asparagine synthase (glutamine-hydrolysing)